MRGAESSKWFMSYEITLNWNITTYEVTATGGCEAPTIITSFWLYRNDVWFVMHSSTKIREKVLIFKPMGINIAMQPFWPDSGLETDVSWHIWAFFSADLAFPSIDFGVSRAVSSCRVEYTKITPMICSLTMKMQCHCSLLHDAMAQPRGFRDQNAGLDPGWLVAARGSKKKKKGRHYFFHFVRPVWALQEH